MDEPEDAQPAAVTASDSDDDAAAFCIKPTAPEACDAGAESESESLMSFGSAHPSDDDEARAALAAEAFECLPLPLLRLSCAALGGSRRKLRALTRDYGDDELGERSELEPLLLRLHGGLLDGDGEAELAAGLAAALLHACTAQAGASEDDAVAAIRVALELSPLPAPTRRSRAPASASAGAADADADAEAAPPKLTAAQAARARDDAFAAARAAERAEQGLSFGFGAFAGAAGEEIARRSDADGLARVRTYLADATAAWEASQLPRLRSNQRSVWQEGKASAAIWAADKQRLAARLEKVSAEIAKEPGTSEEAAASFKRRCGSLDVTLVDLLEVSFNLAVAALPTAPSNVPVEDAPPADADAAPPAKRLRRLRDANADAGCSLSADAMSDGDPPEQGAQAGGQVGQNVRM
jgi:SWI/SNF-related matrix-associated actin-dependent regulator 1 of chromatin subfamily A